MLKYILLLCPCVVCLIVPFYNSIEPTFSGVPFFYWFLMLLIPVSSAFIWLAAKAGGDDV